MNREELIHVAVCQWLLVLATVVSSAFLVGTQRYPLRLAVFV